MEVTWSRWTFIEIKEESDRFESMLREYWERLERNKLRTEVIENDSLKKQKQTQRTNP